MLLNIHELIARFPVAANFFREFNAEHELEVWENGGWYAITRTIVNGKFRYIVQEMS